MIVGVHVVCEFRVLWADVVVCDRCQMDDRVNIWDRLAYELAVSHVASNELDRTLPHVGFKII